MHVIRVETSIHAPATRCFDLARSVDAHVQSAETTGERAVEGRTTGLLQLGDTVTWEARHFGVRQRLASRITAYDRPGFFQDRMVRGAFKELEHDHVFVESEGETTMIDTLRFRSPGGWLGRPVEKYILGPHLRRFLVDRGQALKQLAESDRWMKFVPAGQ